MNSAATSPSSREAEFHALQSTVLTTGGALAAVFLLAGVSAAGISPLSAAGLLLFLGITTASVTVACAWFFLRRRYRRGRDSESAFRATMAIIKGFFDSTPMRMGVVQVTENDVRHIWDNAAAALHFGVTPLGLEDRLESGLAPDGEQRRLWLHRYRECLESGRPVRFEYSAEGEAGKRWFSATVFPIGWKSGTETHCAYICQDITDLIHARIQAEESSHAKSVFLATMSHELRTPLNSVIGFAGILLKQLPENETAKERVYLQRIRDNGRHLLDLITDILDLSKIEVGRIELHPEPVNVPGLVRGVAELLEPACRDKEIRIEEEGLEGHTLPLQCDRGKLRQILVNLMGNAVKFTERGTVRLNLIADGHGHPLALEVSDSGIGIPNDQQEAIFEPFRQADNSVGRRYGGSGLGLSISRSLADRMGFELTVRSRVGEGSVFRLAFNARAPQENAESNRQFASA